MSGLLNQSFDVEKCPTAIIPALATASSVPIIVGINAAFVVVVVVGGCGYYCDCDPCHNHTHHHHKKQMSCHNTSKYSKKRLS